ncbi:MAG TPA: hypothetical protein VJX68_02330 [Candidatus Binatus sp.]|uniref:hypothetical protein n=1 Tax=Candidatus Binatus sp. TaxID=2811406 RepID=UPI002B475C42|nr:hypothetical protein [Candidatus Binatus sp.]HKN12006.1 hypothetical protein [Candidatus Binatus sp.]
MKFSRNLMTGLIGLAMLAAPITAAAQDRDSGKYDSHQAQVQSHDNAPARTAAPAIATRKESRDQRDARSFNTGPVVTEHRDVRVDRDHDADRWKHDGDRDYRNYGDRDRDYDGPYAVEAPIYVMPRGYAGGACGWARHLRTVYEQDRNTGHPAAAADLLPQLRKAERACGGVPYGYNFYR